MPFPSLSSSDWIYIGVESITINDESSGSSGSGKQIIVKAHHFHHIDYTTHLHAYYNIETGAPIQLLQEDVNSISGENKLLLTYQYADVIIGPPDEELFEIPVPYDHGSCENMIGGFPYIHIFHHFVKF